MEGSYEYIQTSMMEEEKMRFLLTRWKDFL